MRKQPDIIKEGALTVPADGTGRYARTKWICFSCILLAALVFYILNATKSGLWYDEAVEYFYSKYMTGTVPSGLGTANMFERIRITFQPPLYNILMFLWLQVFDSEFLFRLAGILVTLAGAGGIFLAVEEVLPDRIWSNAAVFFYLFSRGIVYYALECAEYNLMLCFMAWAVWYFLRVLNREDMKSVIGFFAFSCLALYSQYGAAFMIAGMCAAVLVRFAAAKKAAAVKRFLLAGIVSFAAAVIPLIFVFLIPQMGKQGSSSVSHTPVFVRGPVTDLITGSGVMLRSMFGYYTYLGVLVLLLICCFGLFSKAKAVIYPALSVASAWLVYYIAVSCSFYGYNVTWNPGSLGTANLGGKYSFFFIPAVVVLCSAGLGVLSDRIKAKSLAAGKAVTVAVLICFALYGAVEIYRTGIKGWKKDDDDVREIVSEWYDIEAYNKKTLLYQREDALFNFYLIHDVRYLSSCSDNVEAADEWIRTADYNLMKEKLDSMGYLSTDEFYFITSNSKGNPAFFSVMEDEGYTAETIYSGQAAFYLMKKG